MGASGSIGAPIPGIPTGTVTFYFTDVEQSTRMWEEHPADMRAALGRHDQIVRESIEAHGGYVFSLAGDQFVAAFHRVGDAVAAASDTQQHIADEPWPESTPIRVRIGIHVGEAEERDNDYFGQVLNRTARIVGAIHAGQIVLSGTAAELIDGHTLTDLGEHRLKDLAASERLWQVGSATFPPLKTLRDDRHNLPVERTPLVGRSEQIAHMSKILDEHRLVTLLGMGGSGKTRLATAVAAELEDRYEHGVWFVDLVPTTDQESIVEAIASAAGLRLSGGDLLDSLAAQAVPRDMLLVVDNCEHVSDDVADVVDALMERTSHVHVIATSREPLDLPDEYQYRVPPLAISATSGSPAVRLFTATAARVGAELTADDAPAVADICTHLDGLPLSIELAASQLRQLSLTELSERLDQRFELLRRGRVNRRRRRQMSLQDVLDDSWSMLDDRERELLTALAAFPSSFSLPDAEGLVGDSRHTSSTMRGLIDRGLIAGDGRTGTRLLETVKLFVREKWDDPARHLEQHTDWVIGHLETHGASNHHQSVALAGWSIRRYDDHRSVEDRLAATGRHDELADLLRSLRWAYSRETPQRAIALIERIERYLDDLDLNPWQSASLHLVAARAARSARNLEWIRSGGTESARLFRSIGATAELGWALIAQTFHEIVNDPTTAFALLDEAEIIARDSGVDILLDASLGYRANYAAMMRDWDVATDILDELEPRLPREHPDNTLVMALEAKSMVTLLADPSAARAALEESVAVMSEHGLDHDWFMTLHLAIATAATGDHATALSHIDTIETLLAHSGVSGLPDLLLPYLALAHALGDDERCRRWLTAVRNTAGQLGTGITIAAYRNHRDAVGLAAANPLDDATIEEIHDQARAWAMTLRQPSD